MPGTVGFIGVGNMGRPMVMNLLQHDFAVMVYDSNPAAITPLQEQGAAKANSPAEVAIAVERTLCMVATTAQAEASSQGKTASSMVHAKAISSSP